MFLFAPRNQARFILEPLQRLLSPLWMPLPWKALMTNSLASCLFRCLLNEFFFPEHPFKSAIDSLHPAPQRSWSPLPALDHHFSIALITFNILYNIHIYSVRLLIACFLLLQSKNLLKHKKFLTGTLVSALPMEDNRYLLTNWITE